MDPEQQGCFLYKLLRDVLWNSGTPKSVDILALTRLQFGLFSMFESAYSFTSFCSGDAGIQNLTGVEVHLPHFMTII